MELPYLFGLTALAIALWAFWPDLQDWWRGKEEYNPWAENPDAAHRKLDK